MPVGSLTASIPFFGLPNDTGTRVETTPAPSAGAQKELARATDSTVKRHPLDTDPKRDYYTSLIGALVKPLDVHVPFIRDIASRAAWETIARKYNIEQPVSFPNQTGFAAKIVRSLEPTFSNGLIGLFNYEAKLTALEAQAQNSPLRTLAKRCQVEKLLAKVKLSLNMPQLEQFVNTVADYGYAHYEGSLGPILVGLAQRETWITPVEAQKLLIADTSNIVLDPATGKCLTPWDKEFHAIKGPIIESE